MKQREVSFRQANFSVFILILLVYILTRVRCSAGGHRVKNYKVKLDEEYQSDSDIFDIVLDEAWRETPTPDTRLSITLAVSRRICSECVCVRAL